MKGKTLGRLFREYRQKQGLSLREFCLKHKIDSSNISKIERGVAKPPQGETLYKYAKYLGLNKDSQEWYEFCDLAVAERIKMPKEYLTQTEIVERMPAFFRAMRSKKGAKELANKLEEIIKKAWDE